MDLPTLFSSPEPAEKYYLTIVLTENYVQSAVWKFNQGKVTVVERSDKHTYTDDKDCVVQTDVSLQELGKESESANEVVFGLEPSWVTQAGVSDAKKPLLKKVTQELSLKAVGFVVIGEAVFQHLLKTQSLLTALLVELQTSELKVTLVKQGKLLASEKVGRSGDTAADLAEGLARFDKAAPALAQLPSKILLFSYQLTEDELANEEQAILHHDWISNQTFLQPPLIEIVSASAMLDAVAEEGGAAVGQTLGIATAPAAVEAEESHEFGFHQVTGKEQPAAIGTSFGVPITPKMVEHNPVTPVEELATDDAEVPPGESPRRRSLPKFSLPSLPTFLGGASSHKPFMVAGFGLGLLVLLIGGYLFLRFTSTAILAIQLKTQPVSKEVTLTLDPTASSLSETTLPVTRETKEIQGSKSAPSTGVTLVGDRAKGKVTLLNKTTSSKTFAAGTVLSSGGKNFTLDQEITVASASVTTSGDSETKTFGKADATITASEIGTESNLGKDSQFRVATFDESTYAASNPEPLAGGSSREVRVVSEQDRTKLLADLRAELLEQAQTEFDQDAPDGTQLVPSGKITIQETNYSAKAGDEVDTLTLDITAIVEAYSYKNEQLEPLATELLSSEIPDNHELVTEKLQILSDAQVEGASASSKVTLKANISSEAKPMIDLEALKTEVDGQTLTHLASILGSKPLIANYTVEFMPSLARRVLNALPTGNRLTVEIE